MIYSSACILEYFPSTQGGCKVQKTGGSPMWDDAILLGITKSPVWAMPKCQVVQRLTRKYVGTWFKRILVFLLFWILFARSKQVQFHNMLRIQSAENVVWFQWFHNCGITALAWTHLEARRSKSRHIIRRHYSSSSDALWHWLVVMRSPVEWWKAPKRGCNTDKYVGWPEIQRST
jgi:hypothetical protein